MKTTNTAFNLDTLDLISSVVTNADNYLAAPSSLSSDAFVAAFEIVKDRYSNEIDEALVDVENDFPAYDSPADKFRPFAASVRFLAGLVSTAVLNEIEGKDENEPTEADREGAARRAFVRAAARYSNEPSRENTEELDDSIILAKNYIFSPYFEAARVHFLALLDLPYEVNEELRAAAGTLARLSK